MNRTNPKHASATKIIAQALVATTHATKAARPPVAITTPNAPRAGNGTKSVAMPSASAIYAARQATVQAMLRGEKQAAIQTLLRGEQQRP